MQEVGGRSERSFFSTRVYTSSGADPASYQWEIRGKKLTKYRGIHKSLRDFQPQRYSSRDGHTEGEHVNRGRDTQIFCPTLQVLDMSTLGDAADVNLVIKFMPHTCNVCDRNFITGLTSTASPRVDISRTCKVGQKLGVSLPLLTCCLSA